MTEELKAAGEIAKATKSGIDASREFGGFISRFISGPLEQGIGIFEDKLKYMRWERQVAIMDKVNRKMAERGLDGPTQTVPLKITIPLLQAASMEDEDDLQELWANLLVNAADKESEIEPRHAYISLLKDLTNFDAQILEKLYSNSIDLGEQIYTWQLPDEISMEKPNDLNPFTYPTGEVLLSLEALCRLGLLEPIGLAGVRIGPGVRCVFKTTLGLNFYKACTIKK